MPVLQMANVLGIIPARGGSTGIPNKNLVPLCGRPLLAYTGDAVKGSARLTRTVVSTDDPRIAECATSLGLEVPFMRPSSLAGDGVPMLPVLQHAVAALDELRMPTIMLWPNADAGSEDIARGMRKFREQRRPEYIRFYKNFPIETYVRLMNSCACAVGNSSAPLREGAFIGVPTVNVGTRQCGRDRGLNVVDVAHDRDDRRPADCRVRTRTRRRGAVHAPVFPCWR